MDRAEHVCSDSEVKWLIGGVSRQVRRDSWHASQDAGLAGNVLGEQWKREGPLGVHEAINTGCLPLTGPGIAFAGCCWGALTVDQRASDTSGVVSPKTPGNSIALSILGAGAMAFVGSTGVHYSPGAEGGFFGGPMHSAFWTALTSNGFAPAKALLQARKQFLANMPHGRQNALELAIERKIFKEFTCLGLGW